MWYGAINWKWVVELKKKIHHATRFSRLFLFPKGQQDRDQLLQDGQKDGHEEAEEQHVEPPDREPWQAPRGEWSSSRRWRRWRRQRSRCHSAISCRRRCPRTRWRSVGTKPSVKPPRRCCTGTDRHRGAPVSQPVCLAPFWLSLLSSSILSSSSLPSTMAQNLSIPLAFVALLHLANEKVSLTFKIKTRNNLLCSNQVWAGSLSESLSIDSFCFLLNRTWSWSRWTTCRTSSSDRDSDLLLVLSTSFCSTKCLLKCLFYKNTELERKLFTLHLSCYINISFCCPVFLLVALFVDFSSGEAKTQQNFVRNKSLF